MLWELLIQFVFRLFLGLATTMALTSPREVDSGFFRVHLRVLLGLGTFGSLVAYSRQSLFDQPSVLLGLAITVTASYTDGQGQFESVTSVATQAVTNVNDAPTGSVVITGTAKEGQVLTAFNNLADEDGPGIFTYQWERDDVPINGATIATYTLVQADVAKTITVTANYTDGQGTAENVTSDPTDVVTGIVTMIPGDIDGNGHVGFGDFLVVAANFGRQSATLAEGDITGDGVVGFVDFLILSSNFGRQTVAAPVVTAAPATAFADVGSAHELDRVYRESEELHANLVDASIDELFGL